MTGGFARFAKKPPASDKAGFQDVQTQESKISVPEEFTAFGNNDDFGSSMGAFGEWNTGNYTDRLSNNDEFCSFLETPSVPGMNEIEDANVDFAINNETRTDSASIIKDDTNSDGEASKKCGIGIALFQKRSVGANTTRPSSAESFAPSPREDMGIDPGIALSQMRSVGANTPRHSSLESFLPSPREDMSVNPGLALFQKRSVGDNNARHSSTKSFSSSTREDMAIDPGTSLFQKRSVGGNNERHSSTESFSSSPREDMLTDPGTALFQKRSAGGNTARHSSAESFPPSPREEMAIDPVQVTEKDTFSMNIDAKMASMKGNTLPFAHGANIHPVNGFAGNFAASNSRGNEAIGKIDFKNRSYNQQIIGSHSLTRFSTVNVTPPSRLATFSNKVHDAPMPGIMAKHTTSPLSGGKILPNSLIKAKQNSLSLVSLNGLGSRGAIGQTVEVFKTPIVNKLGSEESEMPPPPPAVTPKSSSKTPPPADEFAFVQSTPRHAVTWSQPAASIGDLANTAAEQASSNMVSPESSTLFDQVHRQFLNSIRDFEDKEKEYSSKLLEMNVDLSIAHALGLQTEGDMLDLTSQLEVFLQSVACTMKDSHEQ